MHLSRKCTLFHFARLTGPGASHQKTDLTIRAALDWRQENLDNGSQILPTSKCDLFEYDSVALGDGPALTGDFERSDRDGDASVQRTDATQLRYRHNGRAALAGEVRKSLFFPAHD